eukprot:GHRQ01021046.1.p2 GENE.GHRQ01021046.1~~GHRQ01021046.1.p2  ORF type:complete len:132 (-),score=19.92 GHRQ01021046.1:239-634(-)
MSTNLHSCTVPHPTHSQSLKSHPCSHSNVTHALRSRPCNRHSSHPAGTLDYMAPEVLRCPLKRQPGDNKDRHDLFYSQAVDAWAVGVLSYELLTGRCDIFDYLIVIKGWWAVGVLSCELLTGRCGYVFDVR